jgi:Effector Associated Constant Component 1
MTELRIHVLGDPSSDYGERARLAGELRDELSAADTAGVTHPEKPRSAGTKGTALEWAELLVSVAGAIPPIVGVIQSWLSRNPGTSVTVRIDDDELSLTHASDDERRELLEAWLRRHGG